MPTIVKKVKKVAKKAKKAPTKPFSRMSKAEKRVAIAKDVIKHIKAAKFRATTGTYLNTATDLRRGEDLQDTLLSIPECKVCAIGAVFAADVIKRDNFAVKDGWVDRQEMIEKTDYFPEDMLDTMETAFEKKLISYGVCGTWDNVKRRKKYTELGKRAVAFGRKYRNSQDRLMAIVENIVKNKGEFKP